MAGFNLSSIFSEVLDQFKKESSASPAGGIYDVISTPQNWFKTLPYGFKFYNRTSGAKAVADVFFLPISPSNVTIVTHFATNLIPTLYGTVEQHSEQRYYDITIQGTTGMTPQYSKSFSDNFDTTSKSQDAISTYLPFAKAKLNSIAGSLDQKDPLNTGRLSYNKVNLVDLEFTGAFRRTRSLVNIAAEAAEETAGSVGLEFLGLSAGGDETGVNLDQTGYQAFHAFYLFLLNYKKDTAGSNDGSLSNKSTARRKRHPLLFVNYKDNNQYSVAINNFQLIRNADNPMLYNYVITMRAYNLESLGKPPAFAGDPSSPEGRLESLGLDGLSGTFFSKASNTARNAKNAIGATVAAIKGFGL